MSDIHSLAKSLLSLDNHLTSCMRCGSCQAVCPVYMTTTKEADVARGKIVLLQNLAYELIRDPDAVEERLNRCLLCGSCQTGCASGVQTMEIFLEARKILTQYKKLSPIKKFIFRSLLPHPKLFAKSMQVSSFFQGIILRKQDNPQNTAIAPLLNSFLGQRQIPSLPKQQLNQKYGDLNCTDKGKKEINVIFYPGCMTDKIYPNIGDAVLKVLNHYNVGVTMPTDFSCCGMPTLSSGDDVAFKKLLTNNMNVFDRIDKDNSIDYIVTACPSCNDTIHKWWPYYGSDLDEKSKEKLANISHKIIDIHKFMIDVLKVEIKEETNQNNADINGETQKANVQKVTFHDSCHLKKSLNVASEPRNLIKQNPAYSLVEMVGADQCCGCGGSFTLMHPELSKEIGMRKSENIVATNANYVATGCPACIMQLSDMLARSESSIKVKHSIEMIAENL